jgi:SPP1 family predicted phage head-tail adaptor
MIGELDRRISIWTPTATQTATGEPLRTYTLLRTCWAQVIESGGNESIIADTPTVTRDLFFTIRYYSGITEKMRIIYNSTNYNITHIEEIDRRNYLKLTASKPDNE